MERCVLQTVPAIVVAASPDVCHLYAIVTIVLNIAEEEFVLVEGNFLTIGPDRIHPCIDIGVCSSKAFDVKDIDLTIDTGVNSIEGHCIGTYARARNSHRSRIPTVRAVTVGTVAIAGELGCVTVLL